MRKILVLFLVLFLIGASVGYAHGSYDEMYEEMEMMNLDRVSLAGMSYGGWIALNFAMTAPQRVKKLALLSPAASFQPIVKQFFLRGTPATLFPMSTASWCRM